MIDACSEPPADTEAEALWRFISAIYAAPGVSGACLVLQDEHGADVVLTLTLLWLVARRGGVVGDYDIDRLEAALAPWRDSVIVPLRRLRREIKPRLADLPACAAQTRLRIKEAELSAERVAVDLLAAEIAGLRIADSGEPRRSVAHGLLKRYFARIEVASGHRIHIETGVFVDAMCNFCDSQTGGRPAGCAG